MNVPTFTQPSLIKIKFIEIEHPGLLQHTIQCMKSRPRRRSCCWRV